MSTEIVVVGAGMAGLAAARQLAEAGFDVILVESTERVGGRIRTLRQHGEVVELGAEFLHGKPPELWQLVEEAGLATFEVEGSHLSFQQGAEQGSLQQGSLQAEDEAADDQGAGDPRMDILDRLKNWSGPDLTFAEYLDRERIATEDRTASVGYVEGFNAADHRRISVAALGLQQAAEEEIQGDRIFRIREGYDRLPRFLHERFEAAGGRTLFGAEAKRLHWSSEGVALLAERSSGEEITIEAKQAVIALPLGVLQHGELTFHPVPEPIEQARRLVMGQVCRFTLIFRERFWESLEPSQLRTMSFLFSFASMPPVWWTSHPEPGHTLTGWVGGPRSKGLFGLTESELGARACAELAVLFQLPEAMIAAHLLSCHKHSWESDPNSRGAYSYVPAGALDACRRSAEAAGSTLFFAGEHTDLSGHWGTVHAALRSGLRAASQLLATRGEP